MCQYGLTRFADEVATRATSVLADVVLSRGSQVTVVTIEMRLRGYNLIFFKCLKKTGTKCA